MRSFVDVIIFSLIVLMSYYVFNQNISAAIVISCICGIMFVFRKFTGETQSDKKNANRGIILCILGAISTTASFISGGLFGWVLIGMGMIMTISGISFLFYSLCSK